MDTVSTIIPSRASSPVRSVTGGTLSTTEKSGFSRFLSLSISFSILLLSNSGVSTTYPVDVSTTEILEKSSAPRKSSRYAFTLDSSQPGMLLISSATLLSLSTSCA